jgi:hypothetical protein
MTVNQRLASVVAIVALAALMAVSWVSVALAQAEGDGDGFDGDELALPIVLGAGILLYVGWMIIRSRSRKSS